MTTEKGSLVAGAPSVSAREDIRISVETSGSPQVVVYAARA